MASLTIATTRPEDAGLAKAGLLGGALFAPQSQDWATGFTVSSQDSKPVTGQVLRLHIHIDRTGLKAQRVAAG
jgi:hypothetical protein